MQGVKKFYSKEARNAKQNVFFSAETAESNFGKAKDLCAFGMKEST